MMFQWILATILTGWGCVMVMLHEMQSAVLFMASGVAWGLIAAIYELSAMILASRIEKLK